MTYATQQDLVDRFGAVELQQLTDRTNIPPSTIDGVVVGRALADADALIDSYMAKLFTLPVATVPPLLTKVASDLARYFLHGEAADKDSVVARNYAGAVAWLKDVAKGLVTVDVGGEPLPQAGGGAIQANPSTRIFRRDTLRDL